MEVKFKIGMILKDEYMHSSFNQLIYKMYFIYSLFTEGRFSISLPLAVIYTRIHEYTAILSDGRTTVTTVWPANVFHVTYRVCERCVAGRTAVTAILMLSNDMDDGCV